MFKSLISVKTFLVLSIIVLFAFKEANYNTDVTILQDGNEIRIAEEGTVKLKKSKFSLRFNNYKYDSKNEQYYSAHLVVFTVKKEMEKLKTGLNTVNIPCLEPGSGMAAGRNGYEDLIFESDANHYLFYENETDRRLNLISEENGLPRFEFPIDKFYIKEKQVEIENSKLDKFYLVLYIDKNLNKIIDEGELNKITIEFQ